MTRRRSDAPSQRQLRVGEELRHALVGILARGHFRDPALDGVQVTVTEVRVSPDLRNAIAFVVPFGGGDSKELVAALNRAAGYFRGRLAQEVKLRLSPNIRFEPDTAFEKSKRIEQLLHDPRVARDLADEPTAPPVAGPPKSGNDA
ncbi:MAG: 30S ribosome-binding factor RbfA [Dongiaceae bacterium]